MVLPLLVGDPPSGTYDYLLPKPGKNEEFFEILRNFVRSQVGISDKERPVEDVVPDGTG
jgi:hypothetical protein